MAKFPFFGDRSTSEPGDVSRGVGNIGIMDRPDLDEKSEDQIDEGDHDRFSHYVPKDKIVESAVTGKPVRALCGKKWVPNRDPEKFPLCPLCKKIYDGLKK